MKILIDVNLSPDWVEFLARNGFEASHWITLGDPRARDLEIMQRARNEGWVVFTHDLDFGTLLALTRAKGPSVLQVRTQDVLPEAIGDAVVTALSTHTDALEKGSIVTVDQSTSRVRILPITP